MPVYVDDMRAPYGRMIMCHMVADSTEELLAMADTIGVARKWLQKEGTTYEHFDISLGKRAKAVALGAIEVTRREAAKICHSKRAGCEAQHPFRAGDGSRVSSARELQETREEEPASLPGLGLHGDP